MRDSSLEFLKALVHASGPSGFEGPVQAVWKNYVRPYVADVTTDAYGNCVAKLNPGGSPRVMLAGHADEVGLVVNYISSEGYLSVKRIGGVNPAILRAKRAVIHTRYGSVTGVFGVVAPHLTRGEDDPKEPKIHDLFLDIGARNREEAAKIVAVGDPVTLEPRFEMLANGRAASKSFDNRIGIWSVAEAVRLLTEVSLPPAAEICAVSNVQEEVGLLGARQVAYALKPDVAIVVDVTHATDYPGVDPHRHGEVKLGAGPTLTIGGSSHPGVRARLEASAKSLGAPIQLEATSSTSGTDTDAIFWTRGGIPSALISLPNRYMHSPVEVIDLSDLEWIPRILASFAASITAGETFGSSV